MHLIAFVWNRIFRDAQQNNFRSFDLEEPKENSNVNWVSVYILAASVKTGEKTQLDSCGSGAPADILFLSVWAPSNFWTGGEQGGRGKAKHFLSFTPSPLFWLAFLKTQVYFSADVRAIGSWLRVKNCLLLFLACALQKISPKFTG